jgi:phospholipid transport system substrate-binding protein
MFRFFCHILIWSLCWLFLGWAEPVRAGAPTDTVRATVEEVIRLLSDEGLKTQKQKRRQAVKQAVDRVFDYEEMARRSLPNWTRLSASQRQEFVRLFAELLEASYADKFERYSGERVAFQGESLEGDHAEVRTVLLRKNDRIPMNYRLLNKSRWLVYDVVIEGVSLVSNYRSQFTRIISESSYDELVRRLRHKVEEQRQLERLQGKPGL